MISRGVWELRPVKECWDRKGKAPTSIRWVDTDKGDGAEWEIRYRLVARDFKGGDDDRDDLFADTPPLEAVRMLLSMAATRRRNRRRRKLLFVDAKKAHLNPKCEDEEYVELPEECGGSEGMCGKLVHWLYGFRKAASAWEDHYAGLFEKEGFIRGYSCGVVFYHLERDISFLILQAGSSPVEHSKGTPASGAAGRQFLAVLYWSLSASLPLWLVSA